MLISEFMIKHKMMSFTEYANHKDRLIKEKEITKISKTIKNLRKIKDYPLFTRNKKIPLAAANGIFYFIILKPWLSTNLIRLIEVFVCFGQINNSFYKTY